MSITAVSSDILSSVLRPMLRKEGSFENISFQNIEENQNEETSLQNDSSTRRRRISFAADTNFNPKCRSRVLRKALTTTLNIRPIKVGENMHVTRFRLPKATDSSFVHGYYNWKGSTSVSNNTRSINDKQASIKLLQSHFPTITGRTRVLYKPDLKNDDLSLLWTQNRFATSTRRLPVNPAVWAYPVVETSYQSILPRKPASRQNSKTSTSSSHGNTIHDDNTRKRLNQNILPQGFVKLGTNSPNPW